MIVLQEKVKLLSDNVIQFVQFVEKHKNSYPYMSNSEQLYRLTHLVEEYRFLQYADELVRINQYEWREHESMVLIQRINKGVNSISEFIDNNRDGLFIFSARMHTLKALSQSYIE